MNITVYFYSNTMLESMFDCKDSYMDFLSNQVTLIQVNIELTPSLMNGNKNNLAKIRSKISIN